MLTYGSTDEDRPNKAKTDANGLLSITSACTATTVCFVPSTLCKAQPLVQNTGMSSQAIESKV